MKLVNKSVLAVVVAAVCAPAFAAESIETAATELQAIHAGMSQGEVDQKINRFFVRMGSESQAATDYLISHNLMDSHGDTIYPTATPKADTMTIQQHSDRSHMLMRAAIKAHAEGDEAKVEHYREMARNEYRAINLLKAEQSHISAAPVAGQGAINKLAAMGIVVEEVGTGSQQNFIQEQDANTQAKHEETQDSNISNLQHTGKVQHDALVYLANGARDTADELGHIKDAVDAHGNVINQHTTDIALIKDDAAQTAHNVSNLQASVTTHHNALVTLGNEVKDLQQTDYTHHQALVAVGNELNTVKATTEQNAADIASTKGDVKDLQSTAYAHHEALVAVGKEINGVKDGVKQNATNITTNKDAIEAVAYGVVTNADSISQNTKAIAETTAKADGAAAQVQIQNGDKYQGMLHAKQVAETNATVKAAVDAIPTTADQSKAITANRDAIKHTQGDVKALATKQHIDSVHYGEQIQTLATNAAGALNEHADAINSNSRSISAARSQVADNSKAISKLNSNFSSLKNQVNENKKQASAGSSAAMAQANIPQVLNGQTFAVGAGLGGYDGESAVAVGFSARVTESVTMKATVSDDTASNIGYGAGVSIGW